VITAISDYAEGAPLPEAEEKICCKDYIVTPGFVNMHAHAAMNIFKGIAEDASADAWFNEYIWPYESKMTDEDVYLGTKLAIAEMASHGVTAFADHYFGEEQVLKFVYLNDYFSIQTYESLTTYICKENNGTIELIAKGANGSLCFDVSGNNEYLYFIESNVNYDATLKQKECPLFVLNTLTGEIKALIINVSIDSPYFVSFDRLSSGELLFVYCEKIYDPMKMKHFISSEEELFSCLRDF
jgi:hypothetical protein